MQASSGRDTLVLSHLRWNWVFQRPQHLMTRAARDRRVFFLEEPVFHDIAQATLESQRVADSLWVLTPQIPHGQDGSMLNDSLRQLLDDWLSDRQIALDTMWYLTPAALPFTSHLRPRHIVFDCMDELSGFAGASPALQYLERQLLSRSNVVFTGGFSLFEAKSALHHNVYAMPSAVDIDHFSKARLRAGEDDAMAGIAHPRVGYAGVLDERLDLPLIRDAATALPDVQFVFVGPTTKIAPSDLPVLSNIHYVGPVSYERLPQILGSWSLGWMPFALNDATRFISPTKTPEYLAAGLRVVSTRVRDVVRSWESSGLVHFIDDAADAADVIRTALTTPINALQRAATDRVLTMQSWDALWFRMDDLVRLSQTNAA